LEEEYQLLSWQERASLWIRLGIRAALTVGAVLLLVFVVIPLIYLFMPFVLALVLAWMLNPLVRWLKKKLSISRKVISLVVLILVFGAAFGILWALCWALVGQISSLIENWRFLLEGGQSTVQTVAAWLRELVEMLPDSVAASGEDLLDSFLEWVRGLDFSGPVSMLASRATGLVSGIPGFAVATVVFLMASYFITSDYPRLRYLVTERMPPMVRRFGGEVKNVFMEAFGGYIRSQLILSLVVFVILAVGFLLIRQPYSLLLAFGLAVMDFIPIIGAGTVMVPWAVVDVITGSYQEAVELMIIWGVIVLFRRLAEPKVLGNQTGLSPIMSLVGIYIGMKLGGVLGMVLGPTLLLVVLNLGKLGIFRPVLDDVKLASGDVYALLKSGRREVDADEAPESRSDPNQSTSQDVEE
jgi:sporulation integral membrane protein YtvI